MTIVGEKADPDQIHARFSHVMADIMADMVVAAIKGKNPRETLTVKATAEVMGVAFKLRMLDMLEYRLATGDQSDWRRYERGWIKQGASVLFLVKKDINRSYDIRAEINERRRLLNQEWTRIWEEFGR